jgi:hypothetical protein
MHELNSSSHSQEQAAHLVQVADDKGAEPADFLGGFEEIRHHDRHHVGRLLCCSPARDHRQIVRGALAPQEIGFDLPADFFDACFAVPHIILRTSRYPVIGGEDETIASLVPHTDSGFMTLLPANRVPGLSILLPSCRWIDAPGIDGAYVVNGDDILHRWTNERFLSTTHRVLNVSGQVR